MTKHFLRVALGAAAAVGLGIGASGALADGYYVGSVKDSAPMPAPVAYEWNGLSVGAGIGVGRFDQNVYGDAWREDSAELCLLKCKEVWSKTSGLESGSRSDDWSVFGTLQLGYDRLLGDRFLIGGFADFDFYKDSDVSFSKVDKKDWLSGDVEREHAWTIGGRLGYLVSPRILLYGLAGYSQMKLEGSLDSYIRDPISLKQFSLGPPSEHGIRIKDRVDGWTVGAGLEAKLERRLSLKLEYRYSQFDGVSASTSSDGIQDIKIARRTWSDGASLDLGDTDVHSVRAVLSFKLGRDEEPIAPLK